MPEQEDLNTFDSLDCGGAMLMLGVAPAAISYFLLDNLVMAITFGVIAVVVSVVVYALSLITHWRLIPRIVDILGMTLTPIFIGIAVWLWCTM